jgi:diacylglycerol kinase
MSTTKSKYESWLFRTMNAPELSWARPQAVRRKLVLAMVALALGFAFVQWALPSIWWFAPLLVLFIPLMGSLNGGTRGLTELHQHQLDEREGRTRDSAYRKVFWPVVAVLVASFFVLIQAGLPPETRAGIGMAAFILVLTMPTLYLAWTLPDDVSEEN